MSEQNEKIKSEIRKERSQTQGERDAVLLIGQSNMCGRGIIGQVPEIPHRGMMFMLRNGRWVPMYEPINPDRRIFVTKDTEIRSGVSLAASFAQAYVDCYQRPIGLIPCADGGTKLNEWQPGELLFDHAVMQCKLAQRTSKIVGILWHQGESDSYFAEDVEKYEERFYRMLNGIKKELSLPNTIPVVIGELSPLNTERWPYLHETNRVLHAIADHDPAIGIAGVSDLSLSADGIHFSSAAYRLLGCRYFAAYQQIRGQ